MPIRDLSSLRTIFSLVRVVRILSLYVVSLSGGKRAIIWTESSSMPTKTMSCVGWTVLRGAMGIPIFSHSARKVLRACWHLARVRATKRKSSRILTANLMPNLFIRIQSSASEKDSNILQEEAAPIGRHLSK